MKAFVNNPRALQVVVLVLLALLIQSYFFRPSSGRYQFVGIDQTGYARFDSVTGELQAWVASQESPTKKFEWMSAK